jgi:hypothetical protein
MNDCVRSYSQLREVVLSVVVVARLGAEAGL